MNDNNSSSANTVLIAIILAIIVGLAVWWFSTRGGTPEPQTPQDANDFNINVDLPGDDGQGGSQQNQDGSSGSSGQQDGLLY